MSDEETPTYSLFDSDGTQLNAQFSIIMDDGGQYSLVFESGGGPDRNRDYGEALRIALERLGRAQATLTRIEVISREAMPRPADERAFELDGYKLPLSLVKVENYLDLRKKIGAGASRTAQRPTAKKSSSGNTQKRLRLFLRFKPGISPRTQSLVQVIRLAPNYDTPSPLPSISQDSGRPRTKRASAPGGQGFEQDPQTRKAVEEYAMVQAERYYSDWHAQRRDKENLGYDIEFSDGKQRLLVEVKGTRTQGERVIVTNNEVEHAHAKSEKSVLFVVAKIRVTEGKTGPECSGGEVSVYEGWDPKAGKELLSVKDYWYKLAKKVTAHYEIE